MDLFEFDFFRDWELEQPWRGGKVSAGVNRAQTAFVVSPSELPLLPAEPNRGATHAQRRARRRGSALHRAFVTSGNAESRCDQRDDADTSRGG
ncbi:hypothetical protein CRENBAI_002062 [Crenichthys baileyi]|uniref:Uncharacterized protein n=1 Tax=Crenichthys baileyi TaxID=28760 RepID=A0AAV9RSR3_9TELE